MYHVSAQGVDERMINVHYYYYLSPNHFVLLPSHCDCIAVSYNYIADGQQEEKENLRLICRLSGG